MGNETKDTTTEFTEIKQFIREYYEQLTVCQQLDNLNAMGKFLETHHLPKQNYEETENMNGCITGK